jgi:thioredoxin reductase (NADPH)
MKYDVIIVGGACAGLSAAIYTSRRALKTLVLTKDIGGQIAITTEVENYPGTGTIMGPELASKFKEQAESSGAEIQYGEVTGLEKTDKEFKVQSSLGEFTAPVVILSFGLQHRTLNVPGEKELTGKGVAYCATCDGPFFKNKIVGVVGGGNAAFDAADYLADLCEKVYVFNRTDKYRAEQAMIDELKARKNVEIMNFTEVAEFKGEQKLEKVVLENNQTKEKQDLELAGVFIEIGYVTKTEFLKDLVDLDEKGYIKVDNEGRTSLSGLYAAGDVTTIPFKQAVISAGEGAKAALSAAKYIKENKGTSSEETPDWSRRKK